MILHSMRHHVTNQLIQPDLSGITQIMIVYDNGDCLNYLLRMNHET